MSHDTLSELFRRRHLWQGDRTAEAGQGIATGFPALDRILPPRGWPRGVVMDINVSDWGIGELGLLLPLMIHHQRAGRHLCWVAPPHTPYAPALVKSGLDPTLCRVLSNPERDPQILWCAEKLLQNSACGLVLAWPGRLGGQAVRRLQLAVEGGEAQCILLRRARHGHSWDGRHAALRLRLRRIPTGLELEIVKARGSCRHAGVVLDF